jgi:hypothetical protein
MSNLSHDFVTVDMRGLKAALVAQASSERLSVSAWVRRAVARELKADEPNVGQNRCPKDSAPTKVSIRLTAEEAQKLAACARADGISMGALLAGLAAGIPVFSDGRNCAGTRAALVESSAELSTLNRNIHHLTLLLAHGSLQAAQEYRAMLETLCDRVRRHLRLTSAMLAQFRLRRVPREVASGFDGQLEGLHDPAAID